MWAWTGGFCSVEAGAPVDNFRNADNEILISVTNRRSRVRVGTEAPQSHPSCPTTPTNPPLSGALDLGLGWRFLYVLPRRQKRGSMAHSLGEANFPAELSWPRSLLVFFAACSDGRNGDQAPLLATNEPKNTGRLHFIEDTRHLGIMDGLADEALRERPCARSLPTSAMHCPADFRAQHVKQETVTNEMITC